MPSHWLPRVYVHRLPPPPGVAHPELTPGADFLLPCRTSALDFIGGAAVTKSHLFCAKNTTHLGGYLGERQQHQGIGMTMYHTSEWFIDQLWYHKILASYATDDLAAADLVLIPLPQGYLSWYRLRHKAHRSWVDTYISQVKATVLNSTAWARCSGRDHFYVMSRTAHQELTSVLGRWHGNGQIGIDAQWWSNVTKLSFEPWLHPVNSCPPCKLQKSLNIIPAVYPTSFHPSSVAEIEQWAAHVPRGWRAVLVTLAVGRPRGERQRAIDDCRAAAATNQSSCFHLDLGSARVMGPGGSCTDSCIFGAYLNSTFCAHPVGDVPTRRGIFDSIVAGCIPIVTTPTAVPYLEPFHSWTPMVYVLAPTLAEGVRRARAMASEEIEARQEALMKLLPSVVYAASDDMRADTVGEFLSRLHSEVKRECPQPLESGERPASSSHSSRHESRKRDDKEATTVPKDD
jgi:hypothetical protein